MKNFRLWLIELIAGKTTIIMNAKIEGNTYAKCEYAYFVRSHFEGQIFANNGKQIIVRLDGRVELL